MRLSTSVQKFLRLIQSDIQQIRDEISAGMRSIPDAIRQHKDAEQERYEAQQKQQGPSEVAGIRNAIESIAQTQEAAYATKKWYKDRAFLVSVAGVLVVGAYTFVTACQLRSMNNTYKEIQKQTTETQKTANAAYSAATTAANQFEMSERPWLSVSTRPEIKSVDTSDPKHPRLTLSFVVENTGNSMATLKALHAEMWPDAQKGARPYGPHAKNFSEKQVFSKDACENKPDDSNNPDWGILQNTKSPFETELTYTFEIDDPSKPIALRITGCLLYTDHLGGDAAGALHHTPLMADFANKKPDGTCPERNTPDTSEYLITFSNHPTTDRLCIRYVEIGPLNGITP